MRMMNYLVNPHKVMDREVFVQMFYEVIHSRMKTNFD